MNLSKNEEDKQLDTDLRHYWLGQLTPEQEGVIEAAYFADDQWFDRAKVVRDELLDDYLFERLSPSDRSAFKSYFLRLPEHQEHVEVIRLLIARLTLNPTPEMDS